MPEPTTIAPPAPETSSAPAPQPAGIDRFMAGISSAVKEVPESSPQKPAEPKPKAEATPKPETQKPSETKPASTPAKPTPQRVEGIPELRKRLDEVSRSEKEKLAEIETLRKQNEEFGKRRVLSPEVEAEMEQNRKEMADLRRELAESAYERSTEFKQKFVEPWAAAKSAAESSVESYTVQIDEDGNTRQATKQDFWRIARAEPGDRAALATKLFGPNAVNVIADIRDLERMRREADFAIKQHKDGLETRTKEQREQAQTGQKLYETARKSSRQQLVEKYAAEFGEPQDDPEISDVWKQGQEFVDNASSNAENMTVEERAAFAEVMRMRAAWFPRGHRELTRAKSRITELESELSKYRQSEPGSESERNGAPPKADDELKGGSEALAARFERFNTA